jgi:hypothetical protein
MGPNDKNQNQPETSTETPPTKEPYVPPRIVELGTVESLTHGSRTQTSDEPESGYKGG